MKANLISYMIIKLILGQQRDYLRAVLSFLWHMRYVRLRYAVLCYCQHTAELQVKNKTILHQSTCSRDSTYITLSVERGNAQHPEYRGFVFRWCHWNFSLI
jgi:hypothetical protein